MAKVEEFQARSVEMFLPQVQKRRDILKSKTKKRMDAFLTLVASTVL